MAYKPTGIKHTGDSRTVPVSVISDWESYGVDPKTTETAFDSNGTKYDDFSSIVAGSARLIGPMDDGATSIMVRMKYDKDSNTITAEAKVVVVGFDSEFSPSVLENKGTGVNVELTIGAKEAVGIYDTVVGANRYTCVVRDSHTWDLRGHRYVLIAVTQGLTGTDIVEVADLEYKLI